MLRDRRSCSKGGYHRRREDHFEECTILFSIYGCTFNLSSRSLFISADLIRYIRKSIEKSSFRRYWWDAYHNTWCKGLFAADWKSHGIHLCFSPFSILFRHANLALDSRYSSSHIRQKQRTHPPCTRRMCIFGPAHSYFSSPRSHLILCTKAYPSTCGLL